MFLTTFTFSIMEMYSILFFSVSFLIPKTQPCFILMFISLIYFQVFSVEEQIAMLRRSRPSYSSTQIIDCPAKGAIPPHHQGVSLATVNMADPSGSPFSLGVVQIEMSPNSLEAAMEEDENGKEELPSQDGAVPIAPFDDMIIRQTTGDLRLKLTNVTVVHEGIIAH